MQKKHRKKLPIITLIICTFLLFPQTSFASQDKLDFNLEQLQTLNMSKDEFSSPYLYSSTVVHKYSSYSKAVDAPTYIYVGPFYYKKVGVQYLGGTEYGAIYSAVID
ncbi:hypothetical protein HIF96_06030 [Helcococcus kunzii]|uniref:hypothetical protein n=1 Tax=Helcococcus kunzii TaxID=40091 RepID=UPI001BAF687F|nr:hypothetical protein [Helcococcus kunzii]QUY65182.1 hypothetical protein GUI37_06465 [Helcococcus kunzii]QZO75841.1 hypothetical protein HIF96_06030 [Helcococcus kunzii]